MKRGTLLLISSLIVSTIVGCRVISQDEYKKLQSPESPYITGSNDFFDNELVPYIQSKAIDGSTLLSKIKAHKDFNIVCTELGFRESTDLQCNFPIEITGTITDINVKSRRGNITIEDDFKNKYQVLIGPVITGTSIRDVQSKIGYKDFNDQTIYGEFGKRLNTRVTEISKDQSFNVGDRYQIFGAFSSFDVPTSIKITPVKFSKL